MSKPFVKSRIAYAATLIFTAVVVFCAPVVDAAEIQWQGDSGNSWGTFANWQGDIVPTSADDVTITTAGQSPLIFGQTALAREVTIETGATLNLSSGSLTVGTETDNNRRLRINGPLNMGDGGSFPTLNVHGPTFVNAGSVFLNATGVHTQETSGQGVNISGVYKLNRVGAALHAVGSTITVSGSGDLLYSAGVLEADAVTLTGDALFEIGVFDPLVPNSAKVQANVVNNSGLVRGNGVGPGNRRVEGDYTQGMDGILEIKIEGEVTPGDDFDQFHITGDADLKGVLVPVVLAPLSTLKENTITILIATGGVSGAFTITPAIRDGLGAGHLGRGVFFDGVNYNANDVTVDLFQAKSGDADGDADIDITDFNTLATNFDPGGANAITNVWTVGNFDNDTDVDITDFNSLASNFAPGGYSSLAANNLTVETVEFVKFVESVESVIAGEIELIVNTATGEILLDANNASVNGVQIFSAGDGLLAADLTPNLLQFVMQAATNSYAEGAFANQPANGQISLGLLYNSNSDTQDLTFEYTAVGQSTVVGQVTYVP